MVRLPHRITRFASSLTGHLIIGLMLVHLVTLPFIFFGILYIVDQSTINLFLDETRNNGRLLADQLQRKDPATEKDEIVQILDSAMLRGQVIFADLKFRQHSIQGSLIEQMGAGPFVEDLGFGQHDDGIYYYTLVVNMGSPPREALLRLGYDEQATEQVHRLSVTRTILLVLIYFLVSTTLIVALGRRSVTLLKRLREGSRRVAGGQWNQKLSVPTTIRDIQDLGSDLEEMRRSLVEQSSFVKRTGQILHEQQQRLIESESMATVGEMAPVVAHNIRNPLASIRSSAELIHEESAEPAVRAMCADIMYEVDRTDGWLREFLLFSRSRDSDLQKPVDLCDLFQDSIGNYERAIQKKEVEIHYHVSPRFNRIYGDAALLREMFNSLVSNALEAINDHGRITFSADMDDTSHVIVTLRDNGLGIPAEKIEQIYKPFYTSKRSGLGLGLLLVKRIVENHRGSIHIASELGFNTTITLRFPSVAVARARILVIEDEQAQAGEILKFLNKFKYSAKVAYDKEAALTQTLEFRPDVVLLELNLPGVEASTLVMQLQQYKKDIRVIIISGHIQEGGPAPEEWRIIDSLAKTDSVCGVVHKPLVFSEIRPLIDRALHTDPLSPPPENPHAENESPDPDPDG